MLTNTLFFGYSLSLGAMAYNLARIKLQNDYEAEIRALREYNVQDEKINTKDLPLDCMILVNYDPDQNKDLVAKQTLQKGSENDDAKLIFSKVISCGNIVDSAKYFQVSY